LLRAVIANLLENPGIHAQAQTARIEFGVIALRRAVIFGATTRRFRLYRAASCSARFHGLHESKEFEGTGIGLQRWSRIVLLHTNDCLRPCLGWDWEVERGATFSIH